MVGVGRLDVTLIHQIAVYKGFGKMKHQKNNVSLSVPLYLAAPSHPLLHHSNIQIGVLFMELEANELDGILFLKWKL